MKSTKNLIFFLLLIPSFLYSQNYNVKIEGHLIDYDGSKKSKMLDNINLRDYFIEKLILKDYIMRYFK